AAEVLAITGRPVSDSADSDLVNGAAAELRALGPVVAIKAGSAGALAVGPDGTEAVPGMRTEVADTTGAGDSFDAGFLTAWLRGLPLRECLRWGVVAGSLSTRAAGGTAAQVNLAELLDAL
ncbi:MAG: hypothetical protein JOZ47_20535, partial [Kutzneria sp.]|nr:hypothetical protein [Kutzneria sp.]